MSPSCKRQAFSGPYHHSLLSFLSPTRWYYYFLRTRCEPGFPGSLVVPIDVWLACNGVIVSGHCVLFLNSTLYSDRPLALSAQGCKWAPADCQGSLIKCWGWKPSYGQVSDQGGVVTLLVPSCGNWDKLQVYGPLCRSSNLNYFLVMCFTE